MFSHLLETKKDGKTASLRGDKILIEGKLFTLNQVGDQKKLVRYKRQKSGENSDFKNEDSKTEGKGKNFEIIYFLPFNPYLAVSLLG